MAATLPQPEDLNATIGEILATPSLVSYSRALSIVEETIELATASSDAGAAAVLRCCEAHRARCEEAIARLTTQDSAREHTMYERACANVDVDRTRQKRNKRKGMFFNVDKGEHVVAALEALRLEEFLKEQEQKSEKKKVHFS
ncbi:hypothetical protein CIB48_g10927 [Xylaria polymorpha]|nr:hypothetical protein CIB48_g10927 [Xylaria polymorpha]